MSVQRVTLVIAILLLGLSAGFFFSYAASVTLGLAQVDDITYVRTFQAINDAVTNAWFGVVFFGSIFALGAAVAANWSAGRSMRALTGIALALYLTGVAITGIGNVPLNDELATVTVLTAQSAEVARQAYEAEWNRLNLARTLSIGASFAALAVAATSRAPATRSGH
jgi:uncharacterized membrane protein